MNAMMDNGNIQSSHIQAVTWRGIATILSSVILFSTLRAPLCNPGHFINPEIFNFLSYFVNTLQRNVLASSYVQSQVGQDVGEISRIRKDNDDDNSRIATNESEERSAAL